MSDIIPPVAAPAFAAMRTRIAYTINNSQPVVCTYISEDPLFYIDDAQLAADDDMPLSDDLLADISDKIGSPMIMDDTDPTEMLAEQFGLSPLVAPTLLEDSLTALAQSRMGAELLAYARTHNTQFRLMNQIIPAEYDRTQGIVTLRTGLPRVEQILLLARELRRVWQHRQGALIHPLLFHPDHAIVVNRVLSADLLTMMIRMAWELRLAGDHDAWNWLEQNGHDDLTRPFAREALQDFRSLNNGTAATAVFEAWFISERCRAHDRTLIQQMLADYQGYVFKAGHEATSKVLTQQVLASLGSVPFGKNYLTQHASTIMADPIFTDIRDRSNANFLWFIKFEQSFRQTERSLQSGNGEDFTPTASSSAVPLRKEPVRHAQKADIIQLHIPRGQGQKVAASGAGSIVDLQGWRSRNNRD